MEQTSNQEDELFKNIAIATVVSINDVNKEEPIKNNNKGFSQFIHDRVKVGDILPLEGPFLSFQYKIKRGHLAPF